MKEIPLKMAKATEKDLDCATLVIGMIDDIERRCFPRKPDGKFDEADPDYFDPDDGDDCKVFVERLLDVVCKREHGGALMRVVFGMITALDNEMFDPDKDYLDWHPDLVPAVLERQRRRAIEKAKADPSKWQRIKWLEYHSGNPLPAGYCGARPGHYHTGNPSLGWVLRYRGGGGDATRPVIAPEPGMEPYFMTDEANHSVCWVWLQFGKEASDG